MTASRLIFAAFLVAFVAVCAVRVTPKHGHRIAVPVERLTPFAACMGWTEAEVRRVHATPHYTAPARHDTLGTAIPFTFVWAVDSVGVWEHEWVHLVLPTVDPLHASPQWADARACGAM